VIFNVDFCLDQHELDSVSSPDEQDPPSYHSSSNKRNLWLECYNCSFSSEALHIRPLFLTPLSRVVMQRDSIELCLKKQKPFTNMHVCHILFGRMLLRLHSIFIINNQCIVMNERYPLNNSVETKC